MQASCKNTVFSVENYNKVNNYNSSNDNYNKANYNHNNHQTNKYYHDKR